MFISQFMITARAFKSVFWMYGIRVQFNAETLLSKGIASSRNMALHWSCAAGPVEEITTVNSRVLFAGTVCGCITRQGAYLVTLQESQMGRVVPGYCPAWCDQYRGDDWHIDPHSCHCGKKWHCLDAASQEGHLSRVHTTVKKVLCDPSVFTVSDPSWAPITLQDLGS